MTALRSVRGDAALSQAAFAALLQVRRNTFRMWDSGLRPTPERILVRARALVAQRAYGEEPLGLTTLARELGLHIRTLQAAARTGRLAPQFSTQSVFGRPMRTATRAAGWAFKAEHYRRFAGQRSCPLPLPAVPDNYDVRLKDSRRRHRLSQGDLAVRVGAAGKAVEYQWESRTRSPSPVFWKPIQ